jgi:hypothetical protein
MRAQENHDLADRLLVGLRTTMLRARLGPLPATSRSRAGVCSMILDAASLKARTSFLADIGTMGRAHLPILGHPPVTDHQRWHVDR